MKTIRKYAKWIFVLLAIVGASYLVTPLIHVNSPALSETTKNVGKLKSIGILLANYANDHKGLLPAHLEDLDFSRLDCKDRDFRFIDPVIRTRSAWVYYGAQKSLKQLSPNYIIVESPKFRHNGAIATLCWTADLRWSISYDANRGG